LGGITVFVVASAVLIPLGVEPIPFFLGVFSGLIIVGVVVATAARRQRHQRQQ
jgi:ribose/xylose/arabinose/galactoside ABC-type transport system permease subunit